MGAIFSTLWNYGWGADGFKNYSWLTESVPKNLLVAKWTNSSSPHCTTVFSIIFQWIFDFKTCIRIRVSERSWSQLFLFEYSKNWWSYWCFPETHYWLVFGWIVHTLIQKISFLLYGISTQIQYCLTLTLVNRALWGEAYTKRWHLLLIPSSIKW